MKSLGTIILIIGIAAIAVVLWPAPDPLAGVDSVAIEADPGPLSELVNGSEITLGNHTIRIVNNTDQADAVISFVDVVGGEGAFELSTESGLTVQTHFVLEVIRDGERTYMDLYVKFQNGELRTDLVGRKFYEVWKTGR